MAVGEDSARDRLALLDWKRHVFALYAGVRAASDPAAAWASWREGRDGLFASHPQSPLRRSGQESFRGLDYFPYDPQLRVRAEVVGAPLAVMQIGSSGEQPIEGARFAQARFSLGDAEQVLDLYWLSGYGGGLFLPFADATSGAETYGAGRYLLDTVKGADLGLEGDRLLIDFNFAYNPSCCYDPRWTCPLAPSANRLGGEIRAGERVPPPPG